MIKIEKSDLVSLLKMTKREAVVGGKKIPQVNSTVIHQTTDTAQTTSIVRDGVSSIAKFTVPLVDGDGDEVYVANIDLLLGALSAHSGVVRVASEKGKVILKSKSKTTTLVSDPKAKAFPHTSKTVFEWAEDSVERYSKSLSNIKLGKYTMQDGTKIPAIVATTVPTKDFLDALRSGSVNGQMVEKVRLTNNPDLTLEVRVGDEMKGASSTLLDSSISREVTAVIGGGFEHILAHCKEPECDLLFFDFSSYGAGIAVVLRTSSVTVFQREAQNG